MANPNGQDSIRRWLIAAIAESLSIPTERVEAHASFRRLGLDSMAAGALAARLSKWLGRHVPLTLLWEHPNIAELATYLSGRASTTPSHEVPRAAAQEPIAIVGMACRFPGGVENPAAFWELLRSGTDAVTDVPRERFDVESLYRRELVTADTIPMRHGGFLKDVTGFDPAFFGISPREANHMDPQQRVALELAWESLEDAGIPPLSLVGSATGVFLGAIWSDFALMMGRLGLGTIAPHTVTGTHHSIIANRISYWLGLEGPSMAIDTACSASLVAVHLACESLRSGESNLALAGGVNLILAPDSMVQMSRFGAASPSGRCRSFDSAGDGYVRAEGAGIVVLKRLSRAIADGNPIACVIRGTAINNDGRSNGLTAPNPRAQRSVLALACARAGVEPSSVDYIEAHGTGTRLGDPIEASAIGAVYSQGRPADRPLRIGSVKSNIGHAEAAAGIAGLMKIALSLRRRQIPPSLHFHTPNPQIDFAALGLEVNTRLSEWPRHESPARAGVSSFGFGGTNAHVILEDAHPPASLQMEAILSDLSPFGVGNDRATRQPVFFFAGHGSQWIGMGRELLMASPLFRASLQACERQIQAQAGWSLLPELLAPPGQSRLHEPEVVQPAIFSVQVALAELWRAWGVIPRVVLGHSLGEVAAAHVSGALSLEDAVRLVCLRGQLTGRMVGHGGLLLVESSREDVEEALRGREGASVAVSNSPSSTVISGEHAVLELLANEMREAGVRCTLVDAGFPSHSALMDPILPEFVQGLAGISPQPTHTPLLSTMTGHFMEGRELDANYWARNIREPVEFMAAIETLARDGEDLFLEVGPQPALARFVEQCLAHSGREGMVVTSTHRQGSEWETLLEAASALQACGVPVHPGVSHEEAPSPPHVLAVSAHTPQALHARVAGMIGMLESKPNQALDDVCYTAACGRSHLGYRVAVVGNSRTALRERLSAALALPLQDRPAPSHPPRLAFVFPGQGGQWEGMGRELLEREPVFRQALLACDAIIARHTGWSVAAKLADGQLLKTRSDVAQPVLFSFQIALCRLWESLGVRPAAVIGHSMGEVAAAHVSGALSLEDAARIVCARSRQIQAVGGRGTMAVVECAPEELDAVLSRFQGRASRAGRNGPRSFALAGEREALDSIAVELQARGAFVRVLGAEFPASHCPQVEPIQGPLLKELEGLSPRLTTVPFYSTATGTIVEGPELDARHWVRNVLQPVRFYEQVRAMLRDGIDLFLEVAVHPLLGMACEQTLAEAGSKGAVLHSLRRGEGQRYVYETLAQLYERGVDVDWAAVQRRGGRIISLPGYPWQRIPCWPEGMDGVVARAPEPSAPAAASSVPPELVRLEQALRASATEPEPDIVEPLLRRYSATILQIAESALPSETSLKRLGLDSLLAMQLNNRIRTLVQVEVPVSLYLEDRSLYSLAQALCAHVRQASAPAVNAEALAATLEEGSL